MNENPKITQRNTEILNQQGVNFAAQAAANVAVKDGKKDPFFAKKVAIMGTAPSSRMLAPFQDQSWTIWGSSPGNMNTLQRVDCWIEVHGNFLWPEHANYGPQYVKWLNTETTFPLLVFDKTLFPRGELYPMQAMVEKFGNFFFTSTFAWMMALAINNGAEEIGLYGVDMASKDEYIQQRSGGHYFMSLCMQRKIKLHIPTESDLMQHPPLYGFSEMTPLGRKIASREAEIKGRVNAMKAERDRLNQNIAYLEGAAEDVDYFKTIWSGLG